jgi:hypothetical protein
LKKNTAMALEDGRFEKGEPRTVNNAPREAKEVGSKIAKQFLLGDEESDSKPGTRCRRADNVLFAMLKKAKAGSPQAAEFLWSRAWGRPLTPLRLTAIFPRLLKLF